MKIALVHELLTMRGGAERVLRILADLYPDAPIYTLLYDEQKLGAWFPRSRVRPSHLQRWTRLTTNHHWYLPFFPAAVEAWDFSAYDVVVSSSSAFAHGIITNHHPRHISYIHAPARYLWDRTQDVLERAGKGLCGPLRKRLLERTFHRLRVWDAEASGRAERLLAASAGVQRRIEAYWRRSSTVLHPPIENIWLEGETAHPQRGSYFALASTLVPYKRIDLAIEACNRLGVPLRIAGEGPDRKRLERMAGPTVQFLGYVTDDALRTLFDGARATLFPGDEDFGLVPLESLARGVPVVAFRAGGALETLDDSTAEFFDAPTVDSLAQAIEALERTPRDPQACRKRAAQFSRSHFEAQIRENVAAIAA